MGETIAGKQDVLNVINNEGPPRATEIAKNFLSHCAPFLNKHC